MSCHCHNEYYEPGPREILRTAIVNVPCLELLMPNLDCSSMRRIHNPLLRVSAPHWYHIDKAVSWTMRVHRHKLMDNIRQSNRLLRRLADARSD